MLRPIVRQLVRQELKALFEDPDEGRVLKDSIRKRLKRSFGAEKRGERGILAKKVARRLNLPW
jgi:predicted kinase